MHKYKVSVDKFKTLQISSCINHYLQIEIYDGPGSIYPLLKPIMNMCNLITFQTSTTFQCDLLILVEKHKVQDNNIILNYTEKSNHVSQYITTNTNQSVNLYCSSYLSEVFIVQDATLLKSDLVLKISEFYSEVDILHVRTLSGFNINLTIYTLWYKWDFQSHCNYAGLVTYDQTEDEFYEEISTVCEALDDYHYYNNIFSKRGTMLIVVYSYKNYSRFNLKIALSTVTCKTIRINTCQSKLDSKRLQSINFFSTSKEQCVILQLSSKRANISLTPVNEKKKFGFKNKQIFCQGRY